MKTTIIDDFPQEIGKVLSRLNIDKNALLEIPTGLISLVELKKGEYFCKSGKVCNKIGILIDGLLVSKFDTEKGKLNISRFFYLPDNMIVTSFESFKKKKANNESIEALENSKLLCLTFEGLERLYEKVPSTNTIARHFAEESYITALQRIHDLQVLNNEERIKKFYTKNKELFNRVNKTNIASYLRVNRNDLTTVIAKHNKHKSK